MQVDQAIMILGFKTIRAITLSIGVVRVPRTGGRLFNAALVTWRRQRLHWCSLAKEALMTDPDVAYVVGILNTWFW